VDGFLNEIRQRKLVRWIIGYLAFAWGVLQVLDFFGSHFGWSDRVIPLTTVVLATGFVAAVILAWFHGEKGRQSVSRFEVALLIGTLALGSTGLFAVRHPAANARSKVDGGAATDVAYKSVSGASVAVLPFANLSGLKDNEYFSDGITEEILNALGKIEGLRVVGRTSAFAMRGDTADIVALGRKLGVAHLLLGSVERAGNSARVHVRLIDTRRDSMQWSDSYDRKLSDIFAVEDEISRSIAQQLRTRIGANVVLTSSSTDNVDAHDLYLLGLARWNTRSVAGLHKALDYFTAAVKKDSSYAQAWAGIALAQSVLPQYDLQVDGRDAVNAARVAAERALRIDPNCPEAHAALSQIGELENKLTTGEREARLAIRLKPSYMTAHQWLAEILYLQDRKMEGLAEMDTAVAMDPLSAVAYQMLAFFNSGVGRMDEAMRSIDATVVIDPTFEQAAASRSYILLIDGQTTPALDFGLRLAHSARDSADVRIIVGGFTQPALRAQAVAKLLSGRASIFGIESYQVVTLLYRLGARDEAFARAAAMVDNPVLATLLHFDLLDVHMRDMYNDPRLPAAYRPGTGR
jgi:serine/threonine-protein kinase